MHFGQAESAADAAHPRRSGIDYAGCAIKKPPERSGPRGAKDLFFSGSDWTASHARGHGNSQSRHAGEAAWKAENRVIRDPGLPLAPPLTLAHRRIPSCGCRSSRDAPWAVMASLTSPCDAGGKLRKSVASVKLRKRNAEGRGPGAKARGPRRGEAKGEAERNRSLRIGRFVKESAAIEDSSKARG